VNCFTFNLTAVARRPEVGVEKDTVAGFYDDFVSIVGSIFLRLGAESRALVRRQFL
jgi:hypothetical protein